MNSTMDPVEALHSSQKSVVFVVARSTETVVARRLHHPLRLFGGAPHRALRAPLGHHSHGAGHHVAGGGL